MTTTTKKKHGGERLVYNRVQTVIQFGIVIDLYYLCNVVREDTVSFEFGFSSPCLRRHKDASSMRTCNKSVKQKQTHEN
jgi:hypothetical protein